MAIFNSYVCLPEGSYGLWMLMVQPINMFFNNQLMLAKLANITPILLRFMDVYGRYIELVAMV